MYHRKPSAQHAVLRKNCTLYARVGQPSYWKRAASLTTLGGKMNLHADARIPYSRDVVFTAYRDDIVKLVPYVPNVRDIQTKSRKEEGRYVDIVNEWSGGGEIPTAVRAFVSESMLSWTDYARWDADACACDWRIETHAFTKAVQCAGRNSFLAEGPDKTILEVRGTLAIDPKQVPGVPSFLAGEIARALESFLVDRIQSNVVETTNGLAKYLAAK